MKQFIEFFRRDGAGDWVCIEAVTLHVMMARVQVSPGTHVALGQKFMNIDLAEMLEAQYSRAHPKTSRLARS